MRSPRPGSRWSLKRMARRCRYAIYIESEPWYQRRQRWRAEWVARTGTEPTCLACGTEWTLRAGDLHHRSYGRLGTEAFEDVIPLCRACHTAVHDVWDGSPAWRRLGRRQASDGIVAALGRTRNPIKEETSDGHSE
jgi:5-methylcytosine-specific restriction endonuclease McrA